MKKHLKAYYKPTPVKWRKLGDSLLGVSGFIVGCGIFTGNKWLSIAALAIGIIGKFLTNFFAEE